jgi:lipoprotein-anchoring transpeptidase ErfK/SrfK
MPLRRLPQLLVIALAATALAGCGPSAPTDSEPATGSATGSVPPTGSVPSTRAPATVTTGPGTDDSPSPTSALSATAVGRSLRVHAAPDGALARSLPNPRATGAPLTLLVKKREGAWLQVFLPVRPNGSTGWVRSKDVLTARVLYRIEISTTAHRLRLYESGRLVGTYPAATGTGGTPTPVGSFFLTELLAPTNAGYGPYAYGLSAFSDVLSSFGGGPGQIGLHGTSDTKSIGRSSSHGCIRLHNADIAALAKLLPLGTPVNVT